jgi:putative DNA primase/helicase
MDIIELIKKKYDCDSDVLAHYAIAKHELVQQSKYFKRKKLDTLKIDYSNIKAIKKPYDVISLVVPLFDISTSEIKNIQYIDDDGTKMFLAGKTTNGLAYVFNGDESEVFICEGFATAATIHAATGKTTYAAMSCINLIDVYKILKFKYKANQIVFALDYDLMFSNSMEIKKLFCQKYNIAIAICDDEEDTTTKDFNDILIKYDLETVKRMIEERL